MFHTDKGTPFSYHSQAFALRKACERILFGGVREVVYLCPRKSEGHCLLGSMVEQLTCNEQVVGSSPTGGSECMACGGYTRGIAFGSSIGLVFLMPFLLFLQLSSYIVP